MPSAEQKSDTERRLFPRLNLNTDVEYSILDKGPLKKISSTKNISSAGICIIGYEDIPVDTILSLRIYLADSNIFVQTKGRVVWRNEFIFSSEKRKRYDIGVEFVEISEVDRQKISQYVFSLLPNK